MLKKILLLTFTFFIVTQSFTQVEQEQYNPETQAQQEQWFPTSLQDLYYYLPHLTATLAPSAIAYHLSPLSPKELALTWGSCFLVDRIFRALATNLKVPTYMLTQPLFLNIPLGLYSQGIASVPGYNKLKELLCLEATEDNLAQTEQENIVDNAEEAYE